MTFVHLTAPNGKTVLIRPDQVVTVRLPLPHEMADTTQAVIVLSNGFQGVRETVAEVEAKL